MEASIYSADSGGVKHCSESIIKKTDVICSGYDRTDSTLNRVFGST
jgi:hypothetical protein